MDGAKMQAESNSATVHHDFNERRGEMLPHYVVRDFGKHIGPNALAVYWAIKSYQGDKPDAYPKVKTLAKTLGCSRDTVLRAIKKLEYYELINVHREHGKTSRYSTRKPSSNWSQIATTPKVELVANSNHHQSQIATTPVANSNQFGSDYIEYPSEHNEVNTVEEKKEQAHPSQELPPKKIQPQELADANQLPAPMGESNWGAGPTDVLVLAGGAVTPARLETSPQFDQFWEAYPRKGKIQEAWDIWQAERLDQSIDQILFAIGWFQRNSKAWIDAAQGGEDFRKGSTSFLENREWTSAPNKPEGFRPTNSGGEGCTFYEQSGIHRWKANPIAPMELDCKCGAKRRVQVGGAAQ